jgi:hypothetical protein
MKKSELRQIIQEEQKILSEAKKYPELDKLAKKLAIALGDNINKETAKIKSEMPYKAQYVLEKIIGMLEAAV